MIYVWMKSEYGRGFQIGQCISRADAVQHIKDTSGYEVGDHHLTPQRLKIVEGESAIVVAERMFNAA